jgi:hypothetical protein
VTRTFLFDYAMMSQDPSMRADTYFLTLSSCWDYWKLLLTFRQLFERVNCAAHPLTLPNLSHSLSVDGLLKCWEKAMTTIYLADFNSKSHTSLVCGRKVVDNKGKSHPPVLHFASYPTITIRGHQQALISFILSYHCLEVQTHHQHRPVIHYCS